MFRGRHSRTRDPLAQRLRDEAEQAPMVFSESLHRRVWESVQRQIAERPLPVVRAEAHRRARLVLTLTAAAVLLLVCGVPPWRAASSRRAESPLAQTDASQGAGPKVPGSGLVLLPESAHRAAQEVDRLVDVIVASQRWASLDHDAELALSMVARAVPLGRSRTPAAPQPPAN